MNKPISTDQTPENISRIIQFLTVAPEALERLSRRFNRDQFRKPLGSGERTPTEVLAHLVNTEALSSESIYLALLINEPLLHNLHSERDIGKLLRFDLLEFSELLEYFNVRRTVLLRVLASLSDKEWGRVVREDGKQRKESVYWRARGMAVHEQEHLADLEVKTQDWV